MIAKPFSPDNTCVVGEAPSVELDKSYIGSCTGAKYEDLEAAAKVLKGRKVKIRTEVLPAAISIYQRAMENGLLKIFLDAGVTVGPPTCGACAVLIWEYWQKMKSVSVPLIEISLVEWVMLNHKLIFHLHGCSSICSYWKNY